MSFASKKARVGNLRTHHIEAIDKYSQDAMVVLTPNDQFQNTSYRVKDHNLDIICKELSRGQKLLERLKPRSNIKYKANPNQETEESKEPSSSQIEESKEEQKNYVEEESKEKAAAETDKQLVSWTQLFKRLRFFVRYEHFIKLDILAQNSEENLKWKSYVDKKMNELCDMLFNEFREQLLELRLNPRPFSKEEIQDGLNLDWSHCTTYFIGLKFSKSSEQKPIDLRSSVQKFCLMLDMNRYNKQDCNCRILHYARDQLDQNLVQRF